ncbi:hypothetical protein [Rothia nasimurium]|uniref:hypothetical protein n=1 Tax=Rothia nasimurium TaxID=85336 RepID=UPI001F378BC3|nr:hypothetical protein [Rothia nasimurium]
MSLTRLNTIITEAFSPFTLAGILITLIAITTDPTWGTPVAISLTFIVALPLALTLWMARTGRTTDHYINIRKQRTPFYAGTLLSLITGAIALNFVNTSHEVPLALNLSIATLIIVTIVNLKLKVSIHALVGALFATVAPLYLPLPHPLGYTLGIIIWALTVNSRRYLKRHNGLELTTGTIFGLMLAATYLTLR